MRDDAFVIVTSDDIRTQAEAEYNEGDKEWAEDNQISYEAKMKVCHIQTS